MLWIQKDFVLPVARRGFHPVTREVLAALPELARVAIGQLHVFIRHTSASLALTENASPEVALDFERFFNRLVPENARDYAHGEEGPDDMPAHLKASLLGSSLLLPVRDGRLHLGVWQGIFLCEHRNHAGPRQLTLTLSGQERA